MPNSQNVGQETDGDTPLPAHWRGYALAVLCLAIAFGIRWLLDPIWGDRFPYMVFFFAVFAVIQIGGIGPFLFTLVVGFLLGDWFFQAPRHSLLIHGATNQVNTFFYFAISFTMLYFTEKARRALAREKTAREEIRKHAGALEESRTRFEHLFEHSPAPTWVEDWGELKIWLEELQHQGAGDLRAFFQEHPEAVRHALGLIRVLDVNEAAVRLTGASSKAEVAVNLPKLLASTTYQTFREDLTALWKNECHVEHESNVLCMDGRRLDVVIHIDVPRRSGRQELDFTNVVVTAMDITERKKAELEQAQMVKQLQTALAEVKTLSGMLPICASCKKIRDDQGYWNQIELYILQHSNANFTHSLCPECSSKLFPDLYID